MKEFEKIIGYTFRDKSLIERALWHSSYANENHSPKNSNERLEFLGDSVLGFITAEYYYKNSSLPEGELTRLRASTVCEKALFEFSKEIELYKFIKLGKGEENTGGRDRASINSDAFEAVIAAIYLDGGMEEAKNFVLRFVEGHAKTQNTYKDCKTKLQEVIQKNPEEKLEYVLVGEYGPDHNKTFEVEVHLNSNVIGRGSGSSKKNAEQEAAREALALMGL